MIIYNDYNYTNEDIRYMLDLNTEEEITPQHINDYLYSEYQSAKYFLQELDNAPMYIVQASTYPELYGGGKRIGYKTISSLLDLFTLTQDANEIDYDASKHRLTAKFINHDNTLYITIKAVNDKGMTYYNNHNNDYDTYKKLFDNYSKGVR